MKLWDLANDIAMEQRGPDNPFTHWGDRQRHREYVMKLHGYMRRALEMAADEIRAAEDTGLSIECAEAARAVVLQFSGTGYRQEQTQRMTIEVPAELSRVERKMLEQSLMESVRGTIVEEPKC